MIRFKDLGILGIWGRNKHWDLCPSLQMPCLQIAQPDACSSDRFFYSRGHDFTFFDSCDWVVLSESLATINRRCVVEQPWVIDPSGIGASRLVFGSAGKSIDIDTPWYAYLLSIPTLQNLCMLWFVNEEVDRRHVPNHLHYCIFRIVLAAC